MKFFIYFPLVVFFTLSHCSKRSSAVPQQDVPENRDSISIIPHVIEMGSGSGGKLIIDGTGKTFPPNTVIRIKGGNYSSIDIKYVTGTKDHPVRIENDGLIESSGELYLENLTHVTISGKGTQGIEKGFIFKDNSYRAVQMNGLIKHFVLEAMSFINIGDNVITYKFNELYTGSDISYAGDISLRHIDCDHTGQFYAGSGSVDNGIKGLVRNFEIAYLNFRNSPDVGSVVWMGNVEDYNIHHNHINNINTKNDNHNGIFLLTGNGKFHHNLIRNHQGNAIRAFAHTIGNKPKEVLIYNNIVYNSRKYSAFEVQAFDFNVIRGVTTFVNAKIFNNTCGNINTSKDWEGAVADVYSLHGGSCEIFNNLCFNFPKPNVIWTQQSDLAPIAKNNLYFHTAKEAGLTDESAFKIDSRSPAKRKGTAHPLVVDDFYGTKRNAPPSVGAVE